MYCYGIIFELEKPFYANLIGQIRVSLTLKISALICASICTKEIDQTLIRASVCENELISNMIHGFIFL